MCKGTLMVTNLRAIFVEVKVAIAKRVFTHHHHPLFVVVCFFKHHFVAFRLLFKNSCVSVRTAWQ
jgi:hypothetical protein